MPRATNAASATLERAIKQLSAALTKVQGESEDSEEGTAGDTKWHTAIREDVELDLIGITAADLNVKNQDGDTPLNLAVKEGRLACVEILLEIPSLGDVNSADKDGYTAIHSAVEHDGKSYNECPQFMQLLLEKRPSANVNAAENEYFDTPIHLAAGNNAWNCMELLLERPEANVNAPNSFGESPIHVAVNNKAVDCLQLLLKRREANLNMKDDDGNTPLHSAAENADADCMKLLLERLHADKIPVQMVLNDQNKDFVDVLNTSVDFPRVRQCKELLRQHGVEI